MKLFKKYTLIAGLIGASLVRGNAQQTTEDLNTPYHVAKFKMHLLLISMDGLFSYGAGLHARYQFKHVLLEVYGTKIYYSIFEPTDYTATTNTLKNRSHIEAGGEIYFADYTVFKSYSRSSDTELGGGWFRRTTTFDGSGEARRIFALRAFVSTETGYTPLDSATTYYSNYQTQTLALGLARKRIDKYVSGHHEGTHEFFIDMLFGTTILDKAPLPSGGLFVPQTPSYLKLGWRIGGEYYSHASYLRWEFGNRPCFYSTSKKSAFPDNYFLLTFGIRIVGKEKWSKNTD